MELGRGLRDKEFSAEEVLQAFYDRIDRLDPQVGSFLAIDREAGVKQARSAQNLIDSGSGGPLCGVPVAVKDNISTKGLETTCASKILKGYIPPYDATVVKSLHNAGIPILGKTNMDEFAMGASTETSSVKLAHNPWDLNRSPGGSSGGSAAAVAAKLAPISIGSDTGGSIRQPASLCGAVGFKPTYGRCSRFGLVAFASSLDQIGPFGRNVEDAAELAAVITGHDHLDCTSREIGAIQTKDLKNGTLKGKKIGILTETLGEGTDDRVKTVFADAIKTIQGEGAEVKEVSIPTLKYGVTTYYIIAPAEASSNLARFDGIRYGARAEGAGHIQMVEKTRAEGFGKEVKTRIMIGTYALSAGYYDAFYVRAQTIRAMMTAELNRAFEEFDFLISPTSPIPAFELGSLMDDPLALKVLDFCTIPANMAGIPGISLNCGFTQGLPVGLQLLAPACADERLLQAAYCCEGALSPVANWPELG